MILKKNIYIYIINREILYLSRFYIGSAQKVKLNITIDQLLSKVI